MAKLRLLMLVGLLAAALIPLYGCGLECADGTTDQDGECVVAANGCAAGTVLQDGECLLDEDGCGEGTTLDGAVCVPIAEVCTEDTLFDEGQGACVPDTDIICGEGTALDDDGLCAPTAEACADKTRRDDDGRCVIESAACGEGTELDPNTGRCLLADNGCGEGLSFDSETLTCLPSEAVCAEGTSFDADSGLCLNDTCNVGDVLVGGVCIAPADDLATSPNLTETENNDPNFGGTTETLFVGFPGDAPYIFMGTIGEPTDLDGDGKVDQDVDVYEFEANAGEWFDIAVHSRGFQAPAFIIEGPEDFVRYSPIGRSNDAARQFLAPVEGTYTMRVLPSLVVQSPDEGYAFGGADWEYVGSLQTIVPPTPVQVDASSGSAQFDGDYSDLSDNLFELTNLQAGAVLSLFISFSGADAEGSVLLLDDAFAIVAQGPAEGGTSFDLVTGGASSAFVLFDWARITGPETQFSASVDVLTRFESTPNASIPDSTPSGLDDTINVADCAVVTSISVDMDITHTFRGDLIVELTNPDGTTVRLHDGTGGGSADIIGNYPDDLSPAGDLEDFVGANGTGDWTLNVSDNASFDTGTLNAWALNMTCQ